MVDKHVAIQRAGRVTSNGNGSTRTVVLAIAGDSAAGKTTLTGGLVEALGEDQITHVCVDDYHRYDRAERKTVPFTPLHPDCNYVQIMEQHLQLLSMGQPILKPVYDHKDGTLGRPVLIEPRPFVVVEGLLPLYTKLARACADVTVYLDPPEQVRRAWKIHRDTTKRGYSEAEVLADLDRREPDSQAFVRPQRDQADIVVRFAPIEERGEPTSAPSATLLLRPTISHPDLSTILGEDTRQALHLKLWRDENGKPVDAVHVHNYASQELIDKVMAALWDDIGLDGPLPESLGMVEPGDFHPAVALTQLILLYHMVQARQG